ncbi:rubredoxin [Candidatus Dependentiae bacterium]|nr:rubredoxin [Candidatus Dependentiae bacterium]
MQAYICTICGFLYDDESADLAPDGTTVAFEDLDLEWECPGCGSKGTLFKTTDSVRPPDIPAEKQ